jgi:hypothetical protein
VIYSALCTGLRAEEIECAATRRPSVLPGHRVAILCRRCAASSCHSAPCRTPAKNRVMPLNLAPRCHASPRASLPQSPATRRTAALPRVAAASPCLPRTALGRPSCHRICSRRACALRACFRRTHVYHGALDRPSRRDTLFAGERVATTAVAKPHCRPTPAAPPLPLAFCQTPFMRPFSLEWRHTHQATHAQPHEAAKDPRSRESDEPIRVKVQNWTFSCKPPWASAHESLLSPRVNQAGPREKRVVFQTLEPWAELGQPIGPQTLWAQLRPTKPADC